jgi:glutamate racemase
MKSAANHPIGFFDSGVGGLSVWKEVQGLLPFENTIYLADSRHAPYGEKTRDRITELSSINTELLISRGCKMIVVACNTATTNAIAQLRASYKVPFIGIEPATKPAAIQTKTGVIGILATRGTLASELFLNTSSAYRGDVKIIETVGTGLVPIVESGRLEEAVPLLQKYVMPMVEQDADNIVLGCTHYPFLRAMIEAIVPDHVNVIDSGAAVARQCKSVLEKRNLSASRRVAAHEFYTNKDVDVLRAFLETMGARNYSSAMLDF